MVGETTDAKWLLAVYIHWIRVNENSLSGFPFVQ